MQVLKQATSILSEIAGSFVPAPEPSGERVAADAGNSFGEASYRGRGPWVHLSNGYPQEFMGDHAACPRLR